MVASYSLPTPAAVAVSAEQRLLVNGVSWKDYVILREALDTPGLRMTYLKGALELMSPSRAHETNKTVIARLIETYALYLRLPLNGHGSTTFRSEAKERGAEPDECWVLGKALEEGAYPDIVLEVIETSPLLDKLTVYDGFSVPEVWLFEKGKFSLYERSARIPRGASHRYVKVESSSLMPQIDFALVERLSKHTDQLTALEELAEHVPAPKAKRKRS
jgi:Uma2 family endonuclease